MAPVLPEIVFSICKEHMGIIWIGTVSRIRKPEVLPDHYAMTVTSLIEFLISSLAYPVAHDREIHVCMIGNSYVVFASSIVEIVFTESPVASASDESTTVDINMKDSTFFISIYLSDSCLEANFIRNPTVDFEYKAGIIEILLTISLRPPQLRILNFNGNLLALRGPDMAAGSGDGDGNRSRAGDGGHMVGDVHNGVHIEQGVHVLADNSQTLQTHAGIDVLLNQLGVVAVAVVVKLGEDVVPDFHVAVAVAADGAAGLAAAILLATVVVDLGAGAAGTGAVLPEVVLLAEAEDVLGLDADFLVPDLESFLVVLVDGGEQTILGQGIPGKAQGQAQITLTVLPNDGVVVFCHSTYLLLAFSLLYPHSEVVSRKLHHIV